MRMFSFIILIFFISGCSKSSEPNSDIDNIPNYYAPLNVGDIRQFVRQSDSATVLQKVIFTTKRQDGVNAFAMETTNGTNLPDTFYCVVRNGYFKGTNLNTGSNPSNPYNEQNIITTNPSDGDRFIDLISYPDTVYKVAKYFPSRNTLCGIFNNVFGFTTIFHYSNGGRDTSSTSYFAKDIGCIGSSSKHLELNSDISYLKIGNQEYGKLRPPKSITPMSNINNPIFQKRVYRKY